MKSFQDNDCYLCSVQEKLYGDAEMETVAFVWRTGINVWSNEKVLSTYFYNILK